MKNVYCFLLFFQLITNIIVAQPKTRYLKIDSLKAEYNQQADTSKVLLLIELGDLMEVIEVDSSIAYYQKAKTLSEKIDYTLGRFKACVSIARTHGDKGLPYAQEAVAISIASKKEAWEESAYSVLGYVYYSLRWNSLSLETYLKALALQKKLLLNDDQLRTELTIATLQVRLNKDIDLAKKNLIKGVPRVEEEINKATDEDEKKRIKFLLGNLITSIGTTYQKLLKYDSSNIYYFKALSIFESVYPSTERALLGGLGTNYKQLGDLERANQYFERQLSLSIQANDVANQIVAYKNLGALNQILKLHSKAEISFAAAVKLKDKVFDLQTLSDVFDGLSVSLEQQHKYKEALEAKNQAVFYKDSLKSRNDHDRFLELTYLHESQLATLKNHEIEYEKKYFRKLTYLLSSVLFLTVIAMVLFFLWLRLRSKKAILQRIVENEENEKRKIEMKNEKERLQLELQHKIQEITTIAVSMVQKNETILSLQQSINEIKNAVDSPEAKSKLGQLSKRIDLTTQVEEEWITFRNHFNQVHPDFFINMKLAFPELSQNDIKLATFLKLNLDTKQIGAMLGVSPDSIKVMKHRLKRKLNIEPEQSIEVYFEKIDMKIKNNLARTNAS
jgi:tetratricopeptide (TPR) repeat protein